MLEDATEKGKVQVGEKEEEEVDTSRTGIGSGLEILKGWNKHVAGGGGGGAWGW